jgi:hypothetical protein
MWLYCWPWYFSPRMAYFSSCQIANAAKLSRNRNPNERGGGGRDGRGGEGRGVRDGRLRGWCRRLASSPSASAAAASGMLSLGLGVVVLATRFLRASRPPAPKMCPPKTHSSNREHGLRRQRGRAAKLRPFGRPTDGESGSVKSWRDRKRGRAFGLLGK